MRMYHSLKQFQKLPSNIEMALISCFVLLVAVSAISSGCIGATDDVTAGTELVFAFMIHRHGDRTPISTTLALVPEGDDEDVLALIEPWGYGQLTDAGKRTGFKTGEFIRRRYNELLSTKYNQSEIYIRSTDATRTKKTVLTAMSAVYPVTNDSWSDTINWDPVPYTTVPVKYDFNTAPANCPLLIAAEKIALLSEQPRMDPFAEVIEKVSNINGVNISALPLLITGVHNVYVSLLSLGYDVNEEIMVLMPEIKAASDVAWDIIYGDDKYLSLQAGPFLNEFFTYANKVIAGDNTQRVRVYSGHDINVYSLEAITQVKPRQGAPKYGALLSLELRRIVKTGQYVILPVYLGNPHDGQKQYLTVGGCNQLCDFDSFYDITSPYLLDVATWRDECGFYEDMDVDSLE
ncbi:prostatic acid phosphatase-like [Pectinophora gossypiella]|uniref:prostatic acid phosphatase-like n=1 Tax=Pectinophora gossypiella TaxID=13191 RepID=UPI00214DF41E|nr:prostatic acid phosphatase-like [Pectinophora gossypiella]